MNEKNGNIREWYLSNFDLFERSLNGESKTGFHRMRKEALAKFAELGFPTTRDEEWRYTNVEPVSSTNFVPVLAREPEGITRKDLRRFGLGDVDAVRFVFLNGHYAQDLSSIGTLPEGVQVQSLAHAMKNDPESVNAILGTAVRADLNGFVALNTAFLRDGAFLKIEAGIELDRPVHLLFVSTGIAEPFAVYPRLLLSVGRNSRVAVIESYVSLKETVHLTNAVVEMEIGEDAVVEHDKLQNESERAYHISTSTVRQGARSVYTSNTISLGGAIVRNTLTVEHTGEHVLSTLNGLSLGTGTQLIDNHTAIDHARPNCESHELYKAILDGNSRGVFNGKIFVRRDAQKTDAKQTNQALLLSDEATMDTKPQLEIFADDVKCTHGATVGQLDQEQVFYLTTRGIERETARDILTYAFASDVANRVHIDALRDQLEPLIHEKLDRGRNGKERA